MYQKYSRFVVLDIPNFWIFVPLFLGLMNYLSVLWKVLPIGLHINECPVFCTKQKMFLENLRLNVSDVSENVHNIFTFEEYLNWNWPIFSAKNVLMNVVLLTKIVRIVLVLFSTQILAVLVTHTPKKSYITIQYIYMIWKSVTGKSWTHNINLTHRRNYFSAVCKGM